MLVKVMHNGVEVEVEDLRGRKVARPPQVDMRPPADERDLTEWLYCRDVLARWMAWEGSENIHVPSASELSDIFHERGAYDG